jgi:hypothetical protein
MDKFFFRFSVETDKETGRILAAYLQVRKGKAAEVNELAEGAAFANYNDKGKLLGLEILGPCQVTLIERIAQSEPVQVRDFFRNNMPRKMAMMPPKSDRFHPIKPIVNPRQIRAGRTYSARR